MIPAAGVQHFLTLTQPWATLMAIGAKRNETRCWPLRFRGWFAIHAAKGFPEECRELCDVEPFRAELINARYESWADLPRGMVIAVAELVDCVRINARENRCMPEPEQSFGDYTLGRYYFRTEGVRRLREPFPLRGLQRLQKLPRPILESELL